MIDPIKAASPEQVEQVRALGSDLDVGTSVLTFGDMRAVIRNCVEIDPVYFGEASDSKKLMFIWGLEQMLRATGVTHYYFNVSAGPEAERWREIVQKTGAEQVSPFPETRFKKVLI